MKLKNLRKKIRRIETRMREDSRKLAKLKRKLDAVAATKARRAEKKSATRAAARLTAESQSPTNKGLSPVTARRKPNISPERRAQLSAAMKARWAAKRAAAMMNAQSGAAATEILSEEGTGWVQNSKSETRRSKTIAQRLNVTVVSGEKKGAAVCDRRSFS